MNVIRTSFHDAIANDCGRPGPQLAEGCSLRALHGALMREAQCRAKKLEFELGVAESL